MTRFPSRDQLAQAALPELVREGGLSLRQAAAIIAALVGPDTRYLDRERRGDCDDGRLECRRLLAPLL